MCKSWMHASEPQEIATTEPTAVEDIKRKMAGTGTLLICVVGIYACYLWYGVVQEKLYHTQDDGSKFGNTAFTMLVQCMGNALIASLVYFFGTVFGFERRVPKKDKDGNPMALESFVSVLGSADVLITAFVYVSAMYTSNEALKYVSYPMQALAKSCKLIPVLIGGMVINGKRYPVWKYVSVLLVTLGITAFQFAKQKASSSHSSKSSHEDDTFGLVLLAVSLAMDGMSGPGQERIKRFALTNTQQMLATNVWATVVMLAVSMYYDQLQPSVSVAPVCAYGTLPTPSPVLSSFPPSCALLTSPCTPHACRYCTCAVTPSCCRRCACSRSRQPSVSCSSSTPSGASTAWY